MAPKKVVSKADEKPKVSPEILEKQKELKKREKELPKVTQPDRAAYDASVEGVNTAITELNVKIKGLNDKIGERSTGREEFNKKKDEIRAKLDECSGAIDGLEKDRSSTMGSIKEKQQAGRDARQQLGDMKKKLGYENVAEIDQKIREYEYQMMTESLTLKKEKEYMDKIKSLKASKPLVGKYAAMEGTVGKDGSVAPMKEKMGDVMEQLKAARDNKKAAQQEYSKLIESRQKQIGDMPQLFEEREGINKQVREKIEERNGKRDEFNTANRAFQAYMAEVRNIRNEKYKLERAEKQADWESRKQLEKSDEAPEIPFLGEITYIENTIVYLKKLLPRDTSAKEEQKDLDFKGNPDGTTILHSKDDREMEFFYAPTKGKKFKNKKVSTKGKAITHDMETLTFFDKFKVPTPMTTTDIPGCLETLNAKIEEFKVKQTAVMEKKANPPKEEETAEAAA